MATEVREQGWTELAKLGRGSRAGDEQAPLFFLNGPGLDL